MGWLGGSRLRRRRWGSTTGTRRIRCAARRRGKDRLQHYRIAAGSAGETAAALRLAVAWGYLDLARVQVAEALLVRVQQMLWRLTRGA